MHIVIDTDNLGDIDRTVLALVLGADAAPPKAHSAKVAEKVKPAPKPEPEEDLVGGDGPTLADAIAQATQMVSDGEAAKVKAALAAVGAKRVSEVAEDDVAAFIDALA